jgi:hypothetical protein
MTPAGDNARGIAAEAHHHGKEALNDNSYVICRRRVLIVVG